MKFKSFKTKLAFWIGIVTTIVFSIIISYAIVNSSQKAREGAKREGILLAEKYALKIEDKIEVAMNASNTMANTLTAIKQNNNNEISRSLVNSMLKEVLQKNASFLGTYTLWEPNKFDNKDELFKNTEGHDSSGRFIPYWTQDTNGLLSLDSLLSYTTEGIGDYYLLPKKTKKEIILDPFIYPINNEDVLLTSLVVPLVIDNEFYGIVGVDMTANFIHTFAASAKEEMYEGRVEVEILSNNGTYAANTADSTRIGKNISEFDTKSSALIQLIQSGKEKINTEDGILQVNVPIVIGNTDFPWQVKISIPEKIVLQKVKKTTIIMLILGSLLIGVGVIMLTLLIAYLSKPLSALADGTERIATGDLSTEITSKQNDEIGRLAEAFNVMVLQLRKIISSLQESTAEVTAGSIQISDSSQVIANGANEQASAVEEISSSIEQMVVTIGQNTENAKKTEVTALKAEKGILKSQGAFVQTLDTMHAIASKISIVSEIAKKTDMLAINAAIEAARAGQSGKGFGVVASEIRKLAELTQNTASQIVTLAESGVEIAENSDTLLNEIVPDVRTTSKLIQEIASLSSEQHMGANQINKAVIEFSNVVQQNASTAEELSAGASELSSLNKRLEGMTSFFSLKDKPKNIYKTNTSLPIEKNVDKEDNRIEMITEDKSRNISPIENSKGINLNLSNEIDESEFESF